MKPTYVAFVVTRLVGRRMVTCLLLALNASSPCVALVIFMNEVKGINVVLNATFDINAIKVIVLLDFFCFC